MSYRLSFDHPFQEADQHDLPSKINRSYDLPGRWQQPFRPLTVDDVDIVRACFQNVDDASEIPSFLSHDPQADQIGLVISALWKCWGGRSGNQQLTTDQPFRLLNGLYAPQTQDPGRTCLSNLLHRVLDRVTTGSLETHG